MNADYLKEKIILSFVRFGDFHMASKQINDLTKIAISFRRLFA